MPPRSTYVNADKLIVLFLIPKHTALVVQCVYQSTRALRRVKSHIQNIL